MTERDKGHVLKGSSGTKPTVILEGRTCEIRALGLQEDVGLISKMDKFNRLEYDKKQELRTEFEATWYRTEH